MKNYIAPIKDLLDENMHNSCALFCTIGTPRETPRFFNFGSFDQETKKLTIESTQKSNFGFWVQTDFDYVNSNDFWDQFRKYRTNFLMENYPTISIY
jgi:hypothetical protein